MELILLYEFISIRLKIYENFERIQDFFELNYETIVKASMYGNCAGQFKPFEEILLADPRHEFIMILSETGIRRTTLVELYNDISTVELLGNVPKDVRILFDTAKNLVLYSWFVYEFITVAEMQAYSTLELALKSRLGNPMKRIGKKGHQKPLMLAELLQRAVSMKLVISCELPTYKRIIKENESNEGVFDQLFEETDSAQKIDYVAAPPMGADEWLEHVITSMPKWRNDLAHGSPKLFPAASGFALSISADIINALYADLC